MRIAGIPKEFKGLFNRFRDLFSKPMFSYFSFYVYALIVMPKQKKNVTQIAAAWIQPLCRSSLQKFISEVRWEFQKVIQRSRTQVMRKLSNLPRSKRRVQLLIDDTDLDKFGKSVFGVAWYKVHKDHLPWRAIQLVVMGVLIEDWFVPLDFRIYVPQKVAQDIPMQFETKNQMAAKMLRKLKLPRELGAEVMFDSWYLNETVTQAAEHRGWKWYSRCRCNRRIRWEEVKEGESKSVRLDKFAESIEWQKLDYKTKRKNRAVVGHQRLGTLNKVGRVKLVVTSLKTSGDDKWAFFCSNHTQIQMVELVKKYERRWKIEVYFRESRAYLALEHWFFRDVASVVHHLCLSLVAMMTCFCIRFDQRKPGESLGTLGEFVRELQKQNQRAILHWFLEQCHLEKTSPQDDRKFETFCESLGF
jgi:SRSO17 transposase